ncbi:MAG: RNB domain-containing ribonuclease [Spirochaetaceae bacterium]|jgi:exoribonuclease-2|nr:RNB domain-containing ribonuclease [Spirochaetaceae bacterium]
MKEQGDGSTAPALKPGCLALYRGRPALVTETGEKISIVRENETLKVREKDIEVLHPGPLSSLAELDNPLLGAAGSGADSVSDTTGSGVPPGEAALAGSDLRDAWELIEAGGGSVTLKDLAELVFGTFTPRSAWAAWLILDSGVYFTGTAGAISARSAEKIRAAEEKRREKAQESQDRGAFLERLRRALRSGEPLDPGDGRFLQDVEALAFEKSDKSRTMRELNRSETPQEAHRLLLECAYWDRWVNPYPRRRGLSLGPLEIPVPPGAGEERRDLTGLPAFAIDSPWSTDPDDAISLDTAPDGRRILYVHVADPASVIGPDSPADLGARSRGATLYLPEGTWPMLPEEALSRFALIPESKNTGKGLEALTFRLTLEKDGAGSGNGGTAGDDDGSGDNGAVRESGPSMIKIVDTEIFPSLIAVTRLSYEEADALEEASGSAVLRELFKLGEANLLRRLNGGGVHITLPEVHLSVCKDPRSIRITPMGSFRSADMVRECMLLAGEGAAAWAARRHLPFPYITQETGDLPAKPLPGLAGSCQLRRCMRPRSVSAKPGLHWGLGLEAYSQVTSPLRRYTDLLAHQQIRSCLRREAFASGPLDEDRCPAPLNEDAVLFRLAAGDAAAQAVTQAERSSRQHWIAVYLEELLRHHRDTPEKDSALVWDAVVTEKRGAAATGIIIPALGLETRLGGNAGELNELIRVRLKSVRIPEAEAVFVQV